MVDTVIAPSAGMSAVLRKMGVDANIEIVPNGVELQPFLSPQFAQKRESFGFSPDDILLMYVGRLGPEKNLPFLLRSFHGLAQAFKKVNLLIIGSGSERENLDEMVKQMGIEARVSFTGFVPYELLPTYMPMGDAFVTASITEVHPLSVIEAMASGLPVLGIQSPGVGDIVEDGATGYLVDGEDLATFTAKMVLLATDHEKRQQMGEQARRSAQQYAIERTTRLTVDCYQKAIDTVANRRRSWPTRVNQIFDRRRKT
jgi:glycosyltransferase involved in cell wall biosynthesis